MRAAVRGRGVHRLRFRGRTRTHGRSACGGAVVHRGADRHVTGAGGRRGGRLPGSSAACGRSPAPVAPAAAATVAGCRPVGHHATAGTTVAARRTLGVQTEAAAVAEKRQPRARYRGADVLADRRSEYIS